LNRDLTLFDARQGHYRTLLREAAAERLLRERSLAEPHTQVRREDIVMDMRKLAELLAGVHTNEPQVSGWKLNLSVYRTAI